jgi:hypothetical protein
MDRPENRGTYEMEGPGGGAARTVIAESLDEDQQDNHRIMTREDDLLTCVIPAFL